MQLGQEAKKIGTFGNGVDTCLVCAAPLAEDGATCTRINATFHSGTADGYGWIDTEWYQSGMFHTSAEAHNAPPVTFLIKDFLQREGVTALAAPVRERKSLIALNIVHALCTGEKLFGHFEVVNKPKRVLYLCPEVSLGPFTDRVKKIGLLNYVGWNFFYRTMSADGHLDLSDERLQQALPGSVVFLDTAIRFLEGDENSSKDVRAFADKIFSLLKHGAESIVLIHHSPKDMGDHMTLESAMRGSGDMGAFLACCWGTRLQDPTHPYESASYLENLKQRDFESAPFELTCGADCRMTLVPNDGNVKLQTRRGSKAHAHQSQRVEWFFQMHHKRAELLNRKDARFPYALGRTFHRHQTNRVYLHGHVLLPHRVIPECV